MWKSISAIALATAATLAAAGTALVVIPGTGGSVLEAKLQKPSTTHFYCSKNADWGLLWLDVTQLLPLRVNCWADNVRLQYDPETDTYSNAPGVEVRVRGEFGTFDALEELSPGLSATGYFKDLLSFLEGKGYARGQNLFGAPYDFRYIPREEYFNNLKSLIEKAYELNGNSKVALLSHSMGSLISLKFLNSQEAAWKDKFIYGWISAAGALGGASKNMRLYASGDNEGLPVDPLTIREEQQSSETNLLLLPTPELFGSEPLVITPSRNYTAADAEELLKAAGVAKYSVALARILKYKQEFTEPLVPMYCIYSSGVKTPNQFTYDSDSFEHNPEVAFADGDGTLTYVSLQHCDTIAKGQSGYVHDTFTVEQVSHSDIVKDPKFLEKLYSILTATAPVI